jgi:hypothetical protein
LADEVVHVRAAVLWRATKSNASRKIAEQAAHADGNRRGANNISGILLPTPTRGTTDAITVRSLVATADIPPAHQPAARPALGGEAGFDFVGFDPVARRDAEIRVLLGVDATSLLDPSAA